MATGQIAETGAKPLSAHQKHVAHLNHVNQLQKTSNGKGNTYNPSVVSNPNQNQQVTNPNNPVIKSINALAGDKGAISDVKYQQYQTNLPSWFNEKSDYLGIITDPKTGKKYTSDGIEVTSSGYQTLVDNYNKKKQEEFLKQWKAQYDPIIGQYNNYLSSLQNQHNSNLASLLQNHNNNLNALDSQSNRTLQGVSDNNFLAAQANEQALSERGMGTSGVGDEFRTRGQMSANRNLQDAYMQATQFKNDENSRYSSTKSQLDAQFGEQQNAIQMALAQLNPEAQAQGQYQNWLDTTGGAKGLEDKANIDKANQQAAQQEAQTKQDQYLSAQTGLLYQNGQVVKDAKGNPVKTLDGKEFDLKQTKAQLDANIALAKVQNDKDKLLSTSGTLYIDGKVVKDAKGNPIKTMDFLKLSQKAQTDAINAEIKKRGQDMTYSLGQDKIAAQLSIAAKNAEFKETDLQLKLADLDIKRDKAQREVDKYIESINDKKVAAQIKTLQSSADKAYKELQAAKKKYDKDDSDDNKKALAKAKDKYNSYMKKINSSINQYGSTLGK